MGIVYFTQGALYDLPMAIRRFFRARPAEDLHAESACARAWRSLGPAMVSSRFLLWLVLCEAVIAGYVAYLATDARSWVQGVLTGMAILVAALTAIAAAFLALCFIAPYRQRDEARDELSSLATRRSSFEVRAGWTKQGLLAVSVKNNGTQFEKAIIQVGVPQERGKILRLHHHGGAVITDGVEYRTSHTDPPSIYWQEHGLVIPGSGASLVLAFDVGDPQGVQIPVWVNLGGDALAGFVGGAALIQTDAANQTDWINLRKTEPEGVQ